MVTPPPRGSALRGHRRPESGLHALERPSSFPMLPRHCAGPGFAVLGTWSHVGGFQCYTYLLLARGLLLLKHLLVDYVTWEAEGLNILSQAFCFSSIVLHVGPALLGSPARPGCSHLGTRPRPVRRRCPCAWALTHFGSSPIPYFPVQLWDAVGIVDRSRSRSPRATTTAKRTCQSSSNLLGMHKIQHIGLFVNSYNAQPQLSPHAF